MVDAIIRELRRIRDKASREMRRDPGAYFDRVNREVMAMARNVVRTGPHTYTAEYVVPDTVRKKQRIRPKKNAAPLSKRGVLINAKSEETQFNLI